MTKEQDRLGNQREQKFRRFILKSLLNLANDIDTYLRHPSVPLESYPYDIDRKIETLYIEIQNWHKIYDKSISHNDTKRSNTRRNARSAKR